MNLLTSDQIAEVIGVSTKTIRRAVVDGMPVAKIIPGERGGKPRPLYCCDQVKNWFIHERSTSSTAKHILMNCPPEKIEALKKESEKIAQKNALEYQSKAEEESRKLSEKLNNNGLTGDDLQSMQARLCDLETSMYTIYKNYITNIKDGSVSVAEILEKSYTRIATRRQSFEERLPKIMIEKGLAANTDVVAQIINRVFITLASQLDQLGVKLASKCEQQDALKIKAIVDSEISALRRQVQDGLRGWLSEHG